MRRSVFALTVLIPVMALFAAGCGSNQEPMEFSYEEETEIKKVAAKAEDEMKDVIDPAAAKAKASASVETKEFKYFPVYTDESSPDNHFYASGWMGDYSDMQYDGTHMENPHGGSTSIRITYNTNRSQGAGWAGIYWQNPPNNWGNRPGGYDLTGSTKLVFWARGEKGGERIQEFKMGGITGEFSDSDVAGIGPVVLKAEWTQYVIDLDGKDLSSILGGFCWATNLDYNPDGLTFYLDDIRYE